MGFRTYFWRYLLTICLPPNQVETKCSSSVAVGPERGTLVGGVGGPGRRRGRAKARGGSAQLFSVTEPYSHPEWDDPGADGDPGVDSTIRITRT